MEVARISLPIAVLIWGMIAPMMLALDFSAIGGIRTQPRGLLITVAMNWVINPFTMTDWLGCSSLGCSRPGFPKRWATSTSSA